MSADESTPLIDDETQLYDEDGYSLYSETTTARRSLQMKILYIFGLALAIPLIWFFAFSLPNIAPTATEFPLDIAKVSSIPVYLKPLKVNPEVAKRSDDSVELEIDDYIYADVEPTTEHSTGKNAVRRLLLIGDVHGSYRELSKLLKKLKVNHEKDYVLLLGDFISKGPDSAAVLNWAISNNVGCVLGNHEYYILNRYAQFHSLRKPEFITNSTLEPNGFTTRDFYDLDDEMKIAKALTAQQVEYILECPLIHQLGSLPHPVSGTPKKKKRLAAEVDGLAVHAGLQWNIESLDDQDPETILTMRALLPPDFTVASDDDRIEGAEPWSKRWNALQKSKTQDEMRQKVYYGHNARNGLNFKDYTCGLDTSCVTGGKLSALALWVEEKKGESVLREKLYQVSCA